MIPNEPGYYWRFGPNHDDEMVEQVVKVDYLSVNSEDLFYWEAGEIGGIYIDADGTDKVEWEKVNPPVLFAHFWRCPTCQSEVPAYILYCKHNGRAEVAERT